MLILFDLNGVLVTKNITQSGKRLIANVRPGIGHLLQLLPHFRYGPACTAAAPKHVDQAPHLSGASHIESLLVTESLLLLSSPPLVNENLLIE